jgi:hypothetical protein
VIGEQEGMEIAEQLLSVALGQPGALSRRTAFDYDGGPPVLYADAAFPQ